MQVEKWRKFAELVGVLGIVVGLLMVAWEIRQANRIARAQTVMDLAAQYNEFNSARFGNPDVARLSLMLLHPDDFDISPTEASMMSGAAWHFGNILWSAQVAHDNGLLTREDLRNYRSHLEWMLEYMPGLTPEFEAMYRSDPNLGEVYVFEPLGEHMARSAAGHGSGE